MAIIAPDYARGVSVSSAAGDRHERYPMSDATQTVSARTQSRCRLVILLLLFIHSPQVVAESVVVLGSLEFPPYTGKRLHQGGVITQIVREAFARTGYRAEVRYYPWARAMGMAREGDLDGLAMVWMRDERKEWLLFSEPVSTSEVVFYKRTTRAFAFDGTDYLALKPYRIGIVKDYANPEAFEAARRHLQIQAVTSDLQNLGKLAAGRLDLVVIDRLVALHLLRTQMVESANSFDWVSPPCPPSRTTSGSPGRRQRHRRSWRGSTVGWRF